MLGTFLLDKLKNVLISFLGDWTLLSTEVTDKSGRIVYTLPSEKSLGYGIYPVKMVVRGDHTSVDFYLAVIPSRTECVVFRLVR